MRHGVDTVSLHVGTGSRSQSLSEALLSLLCGHLSRLMQLLGREAGGRGASFDLTVDNLDLLLVQASVLLNKAE